ncbi:hypothetical protein BOX15_Mlig007594g3 [Macrostomum lignano]|uniref:Tyrosine-protein kinase n=1 Tax=Macrostomum lignano TaxID=282301 RepID=A0A267FJY8_9PLAT|nr:hypothetical protein BOX15_Mlig007594g1 [Macrostomum lignano]PAA76499.1 hypothetical protein BOX15_Mlig007594g3 [Macrostomum lignano]
MGNCLFSRRGRYATTQQKKLVDGESCATIASVVAAATAPTEAASASASAASAVQMRALYDFEKQADDDLSFKKDDILDLVDNSSGEFWWLMRNQRTGDSGYVPCNYIQPYDGGPASLTAWFDVDRREAERCLLMPGVPHGSFILRPCGQRSESGAFSLSVRTDEDLEAQQQQQQKVLVRHYIVRPTDEGGFYISPNRRFSSLIELLEHYQQQQDGMCCQLGLPCPREYVPPPQLRDFELNRQLLSFVEKLGQGSFGEVWKARLGRLLEVAVKSMKEATMNKADFLSEAEKMHKLHHPKIVQLVGVCTREEPFYIVTEFMPNGALTAYLRRDNEQGRRVTFGHMIDMLFQVADGMCYLEQKRFIHRDLRAANILVGLNNTVKVGDFGLSRCIEEEAYCFKEGTKFPIRWTAPEAAKSKAFTHKSDVWSFGILAYEVVTRGGLPYPEYSNCDILRLVCGGYRMANPSCPAGGVPCDQFLYESVMLACWRLEPAARPTFAALRNLLENYFVEKQPQYEH